MASNDPTIERNFGHCRILWKIKKFSLAVCKPENTVTSKEFSVTSTCVTKWVLGFSLDNDGQKLQLFLRRLHDDYEDSVEVSWKVTILDSKKEGTFITENKTSISQNSYHYVDPFAPLKVIRVLNTNESNEVSILFEIIVLLKIPMDIPTPEEIALARFFQDLLLIYEAGNHSNVEIKLNGTTLHLHKAMLVPRCQKLADRVINERKMQLYCTDVVAIKKLFAYLYTANLSFIFDPPTISMNEYIRDLDIRELRNSYPQEKIAMETNVQSETFEFHWIIPNLCNQMQESGIYEAGKTCWQLRIYPEGLPEDSARRTKYVYIEALQLKLISNQDVYVDFIAVKRDGRVAAAKRKHGTVEKGSKLGDRFMRLGGYAMTEALIGTGLHIKFLVCEANGQIDTEITKKKGPLPFNLTNFDTYKILLDHLGVLHTTHAYSDIVLKVEKHEFKCHKFILAGKSTVFHNQLAHTDDEWLALNCPNRYAFRVFLDFLYTGKITDVDINILMQVYDLAKAFKVSYLKECCLYHIQRQMNVESVCSILEFAHLRLITRLKTTALNFIFGYRDVVLQTNGWRYMETKYSEMTREIKEFIRANVNRSVHDAISEEPDTEKGE